METDEAAHRRTTRMRRRRRRAVRLSDSNRVEAFSDGVFAITITLLVFDLRRPMTAPGTLFPQLWRQWPSYLAFFASFVYVGVIWLNHHSAFTRIRSADRGLHWWNLMVLLTTAILPFPTAILASTMQSPGVEDRRVAVVFYALLAAAMCLSWLALFQHLHLRPHLQEQDTEPGYFARGRTRAWIGIVAYALAAVIGALYSPTVSLLIFVAIPVFYGVTSEGIPGIEPRRRSTDNEPS
jgi:TMEM175 potassium channel family protein